MIYKVEINSTNALVSFFLPFSIQFQINFIIIIFTKLYNHWMFVTNGSNRVQSKTLPKTDTTFIVCNFFLIDRFIARRALISLPIQSCTSPYVSCLDFDVSERITLLAVFLRVQSSIKTLYKLGAKPIACETGLWLVSNLNKPSLPLFSSLFRGCWVRSLNEPCVP